MIDRQEHRREDPSWLAGAWGRARVLAVHDGRLAWLPGPEAAPPGERIFLGLAEDKTPCFAVLAEVEGMLPLREVLMECDRDHDDRDLICSAAALAGWRESHRYHPGTGEPISPAMAGWVQRTEKGELVWPRINPAVLVLIHDGVPGPEGRLLLSRNVARPPDFRSITAGFVSPGESLETTVARESFEELGVTVRDVRYHSSESWPFNGEMMIGFVALADPQQSLVLDPAEIAEAAWYTRAEMLARDFTVPSRVSISGVMIEEWLDGQI
ncbi:NAD(+) diphosphatase [Longispora albida]|uniref:NAD(+) diphosphatase n=1 Tax=Longispora albida TaxID=203523 RepID=UPI00037C579F|nr:NAD(+) diphosphatase [Longispora albida]